MEISETIGCCGINEISVVEDIDNVEEDLYNAFYNDVGDVPGAYLFFSVVQSQIKKANELIAYIEKKKLGTVYAVPTKKNTNSGNKIKMYIWSYNHRNILKWWSALSGKKNKEENLHYTSSNW